MSFDELVTQAQVLPKADRVRLVHILIDGLSSTEAETLVGLDAAASQFQWSPIDAPEAASRLEQLLREYQEEASS